MTPACWVVLCWAVLAFGVLALIYPLLISSKRADRQAKVWKAFQEGKWQGKRWE